MPISNYDSAYGGKKGAAGKALASMRKTYGAKQGERVFYATANRNKKKRQRRRGRRRRQRPAMDSRMVG